MWWQYHCDMFQDHVLSSVFYCLWLTSLFHVQSSQVINLSVTEHMSVKVWASDVLLRMLEGKWRWVTVKRQGNKSPLSAWVRWYLDLVHVEWREQRLARGTSGSGSMAVRGIRIFSAYTYKVNKIDCTQMYKRKLSDCWKVSLCKPLTVMQESTVYDVVLPKNSSSQSLHGRICKAEEGKSWEPGLCFMAQIGVSDGFPRLASLIRYWKARAFYAVITAWWVKTHHQACRFWNEKMPKETHRFYFLSCYHERSQSCWAVKQCYFLKQATN